MFTLKAKSISDAWFQLIYNIFDKGYKQTIQKGSFENEQYRIQYPGIAIEIEYPWLDMIPVIPCCLGIPTPTTQEYIENYFVNYLMNPELDENETYRYASRIHEKEVLGCLTSETQLERVIEMLKKTPLTNQAILEIGKSNDIFTCIGNDGKLDPPCLRLIDFKVIPKKYCMTNDYETTELILTMSVYFRSWDLWAGLPTNLGGLELLKQYVASECNLENGKMYCYSSGLHLYGYQEELAKIRIARREN